MPVDFQKLQTDPEFVALPPREKRRLTSRLLDSDPEFTALPSTERDPLRNRILRQFPDAQPAVPVRAIAPPTPQPADPYLAPRDPGFEAAVGEYTRRYLDPVTHVGLRGSVTTAQDVKRSSIPYQTYMKALYTPHAERMALFPPEWSEVGKAAILRRVVKENPEGSRTVLSAPKPPTVGQKAAEAVGRVMGIPKAPVVEAARQMHRKTRTGGKGYDPTLEAQDYEYNKRLDELPIWQRLWEQAGGNVAAASSPSQQDAVRQGEKTLSPLGQLGSAGAHIVGETLTDPLTYATAGAVALAARGGGRALERALLNEAKTEVMPGRGSLLRQKAGEVAAKNEGTRRVLDRGRAAADVAFTAQDALPYLLDPEAARQDPYGFFAALPLIALGGMDAAQSVRSARGQGRLSRSLNTVETTPDANLPPITPEGYDAVPFQPMPAPTEQAPMPTRRARRTATAPAPEQAQEAANLFTPAETPLPPNRPTEPIVGTKPEKDAKVFASEEPDGYDRGDNQRGRTQDAGILGQDTREGTESGRRILSPQEPGSQAASGEPAGVFENAQQQYIRASQPREAWLPTGQIARRDDVFQFRRRTVADFPRWNAREAAKNPVSVWEDGRGEIGEPGRTYVVNGAHRQVNAEKFDVPVTRVRYIDAPDAATARRMGAIENLLDSPRNEPLDVAHFLRTTDEAQGRAADFLREQGVNVQGRVMSDAVQLSTLPDEVFQRVYQEADRVPGLETAATAIAKHFPEEADRVAQFEDVYARLTSGQKVTVDLIRERADVLKQQRAAEQQTGMDFDFGDANTRAEVVKGLKDHFGQLATGGRRINQTSVASFFGITGEQKGRKQIAEQVREIIERTANSASPLGRKISEAVQRIQAGEAQTATISALVRELEQGSIVRESLQEGQNGKASDTVPEKQPEVGMVAASTEGVPGDAGTVRGEGPVAGASADTAVPSDSSVRRSSGVRPGEGQADSVRRVGGRRKENMDIPHAEGVTLNEDQLLTLANRVDMPKTLIDKAFAALDVKGKPSLALTPDEAQQAARVLQKYTDTDSKKLLSRIQKALGTQSAGAFGGAAVSQAIEAVQDAASKHWKAVVDETKNLLVSNLHATDRRSLSVGMAARRVAGSGSEAASIMRGAMPRVYKALGNDAGKVQDFFEVLTESRLRGAEARWRDFAGKVAALPDADLQTAYGDTYRDHIETIDRALKARRNIVNTADMYATAAEASKDPADYALLRGYLHQVFDDSATQVTNNYQGGGKFWNTHIDPATDTFRDTAMQEAHKIYKESVESRMRETYQLHEGALSPDLGPLDTYVPLFPKTTGGQDVRRVMSQRAPLARPENEARRFTTGLHDDYAFTMQEFGDRLARSIRAANRDDFVDTLLAARSMGGDPYAIALAPGAPVPDTMTIDGDDVKATSLPASRQKVLLRDGKAVGGGEERILVPDALAREIKDLMQNDYDPETHLSKVANLLTNIALVGPFDAAFHSANILSALTFKVPVLGVQLVRGKSLPARAVNAVATIAGNTPFTKAYTGMMKAIRAAQSSGTEEAQREINELARLGALHRKYGSQTYSKDIAFLTGAKRSYGAGAALYGPKGIDVGARLVLYRAAKAMMNLNGPIFDAGGELNIPPKAAKELYDMVATVGQYHGELKGKVVKFLSQSGISPFATAADTFMRNGTSAWMGGGRLPTSRRLANGQWGEQTLQRRMAYRVAQQLTGGVVGLVGMWALAHRELHDKWPWEDKEARFLQTYLPDRLADTPLAKKLYGDKKGRKYISLLHFNPNAGRGVIAKPVADIFNITQAGGGTRQKAEGGIQAVLNQVTYGAGTSPVINMATAALGYDPYVIGLTPKGMPEFLPAVETKESGTEQVKANALEVLLNSNALLQDGAAMFGVGYEGRPKKGDAEHSLMTQMVIDLAFPRLLAGTHDVRTKGQMLKKDRRDTKRAEKVGTIMRRKALVDRERANKMKSRMEEMSRRGTPAR